MVRPDSIRELDELDVGGDVETEWGDGCLHHGGRRMETFGCALLLPDVLDC